MGDDFRVGIVGLNTAWTSFDDEVDPGDIPLPFEQLTAAALRARFPHPPAWTPEVLREKRFADRRPTPAAVLMPIIVREGGPTLLLTERTQHLSTHSGQVAFPGGKIDGGVSFGQ